MDQELLNFSVSRLLSGLQPEVHTVRNGRPDYQLLDTEVGERAVYTFGTEKEKDRIVITAEGRDNTVMFSIDARKEFRMAYPAAFTEERAVNFRLGPAEPEKILGFYHDKAWWMLPYFPENFSELRETTQSLLLQAGGKLYYLQLLCNGNFSAEMDSEGLHLEPRRSGIYEMSGAFLSVTEGTVAKEVFEQGLRNTKALGGFVAGLKENRHYPELFEYFGWCSWDAFYAKVTEEGIIRKMEEFREKQIPVRWIIIDDGWLSQKNSKLTAFEADPVKFPGGLKHCIDRVKQEFGVKYVGVWHAFDGYWGGIDPESTLYREQKENLEQMPNGAVIPAHDEEKAFRFWNTWHQYLRSCGVDFVKVDNQSSHMDYVAGVLSGPEALRIAHRALERSVDRNFNGAIINCMGMDMENVFSRDHSPITRNSDDFFPRIERGFAKHLIQNAYSALWETVLYHCDFDMWWSDHESMYQSGVLRAVSGSPTYVSDEVGRSNAATIRPLTAEDGRLFRMDNACRPTEDCIFTDCMKEKKILKVWNRSGDAFALAAFNVTPELCGDEIRFGSIPELPEGREYVAYEYFTEQYLKVTSGSILPVSLAGDGLQVYSLYPVEGEGEEQYILAGPRDKYAPIAAAEKEKLLLRDIL